MHACVGRFIYVRMYVPACTCICTVCMYACMIVHCMCMCMHIIKYICVDAYIGIYHVIVLFLKKHQVPVWSIPCLQEWLFKDPEADHVKRWKQVGQEQKKATPLARISVCNSCVCINVVCVYVYVFVYMY